MCRAGLSVGATLRIAVTAGGVAGTVTEAFSMDVVTHGVALSANIPTLDPGEMTLGFDRATRDDYSARARVGDTACEVILYKPNPRRAR